jgi:hypothetical protein
MTISEYTYTIDSGPWPVKTGWIMATNRFTGEKHLRAILQAIPGWRSALLSLNGEVVATLTNYRTGNAT